MSAVITEQTKSGGTLSAAKSNPYAVLLSEPYRRAVKLRPDSTWQTYVTMRKKQIGNQVSDAWGNAAASTGGQDNSYARTVAAVTQAEGRAALKKGNLEQAQKAVNRWQEQKAAEEKAFNEKLTLAQTLAEYGNYSALAKLAGVSAETVAQAYGRPTGQGNA